MSDSVEISLIGAIASTVATVVGVINTLLLRKRGAEIKTGARRIENLTVTVERTETTLSQIQNQAADILSAAKKQEFERGLKLGRAGGGYTG